MLTLYISLQLFSSFYSNTSRKCMNIGQNFSFLMRISKSLNIPMIPSSSCQQNNKLAISKNTLEQINAHMVK